MIVGNLRLKVVEPEMVSDDFVSNLIVFIEYTSNERVVLCTQFQTYDHLSLKIFHLPCRVVSAVRVCIRKVNYIMY